MKKISIRLKFSLTIGLFIFAFSLISMTIFAYNMKFEMNQGIDSIKYNMERMEIVSDQANKIPEVGATTNNKDEIQVIINRSTDQYRIALNIINESVNKTLLINVLCAVLLGLFGFVIAYPISGILLRPFNKLASDISHINESDLDKHLYIENDKDEMGRIKKAFNDLMDRLNNIIESQKAFVSNVAHELKTPLSVLKMYPETLDEDSDINDYKEVIDVQKKNVDRMNNLVNDLLASTKANTITKKLENVKSIISSNIEYLRPLLSEKKIEVIDESKDYYLNTSRELMDRVIYNLLTNAIRYNKDGGKIYITLENDSLVIRDTGIGIPDELLERVFEPLYCVDKSRSRELGGSGLGLSIVKNICDSLGYKIDVSSKLGFGSAFEIKFRNEGIV